MASPSSSRSSSLTFADLLRHHRTAAGLTQEELAERANLSVDAISTLERGTRRKPRKDTVALLADALALPEEDRAALAAAARRMSAAALVATPSVAATSGLDGHVPALVAASDATLPHGSVTFLFADIEGSARLLQQLGDDRYAGMLAEVQMLLRTVWAAHAGHDLGTQADHFYVVFADAEDALAAAAAAQRALATTHWPEGAQVRLRMGVHSGAALLTAGRYVGWEVQRAARIATVGHGGQVVVSQAVAEQVAKFGFALPPGTDLRDLGTHRLQDLPHREPVYQLVLPAGPGLPVTYPPLRTLDAWPALRADLTAVALVSAGLLAVVGLPLALVVPAFPRAIGLGAGGLAGAVLLGAVLVRPLRWALASQWRMARKPFATVTSTLLALVVVVTTLFLTKPPLLIGPAHAGYDFSYTYHQPTHTGGSAVIGTGLPIHSLMPTILTDLPEQVYRTVWNACLVQLPDLNLPSLEDFKPDQCSRVPTVANGDESLDGRTTIFRIDSQAVWSDEVPVTADDFRFAFHLITDPNVNGTVWPSGSHPVYPPWSLMLLTKLDERTVRIDWTEPYGDFLTTLSQLTPLPLHVYARGPYAGVYDPATDAYNSALAQRMAAEDSFNLHIPVDNGPFTVQHVDGYPLPYKANDVFTAKRLVLARNPRFFSNYFHHPAALGQVTFQSGWAIEWFAHPELSLLARDALISAYRQGTLTVDDMLGALDLGQLGDIPTGEVVTSPAPLIITMGFNQRDEAPSARANGGVSILADPTVRKALVEAFDRCGAVKAVLGLRTCTDANFHTDEHAAPPSPDYDASVSLPAYNPSAAATLLERAGYHDVHGVRRYHDGTTPLALTVSIVSPGAEAYKSLFQRLRQDYARNLHIAVQIREDDGPISVGVTGAFDIAMWQEDVGPDPVDNLGGWMWTHAYIPSAQNPSLPNFLGLIDPWVVAQDRLGTQTVDEAQRREVYKEMVHHVTEQLDYLPLLINADITLVKPTLCNFKEWPEYGAYVWNMADWYLTQGSTCP
ncbi:MAG TPA: ABC transporter substrate-binding protein [Ktedonobacterales bacterium]